jgi:formyltetrahydrofolate deformylase
LRLSPYDQQPCQARHHADFYGVYCYEIPVSKENKPPEEGQQLELLEKYQIDVVVLARYMQVLSKRFHSA